MQQFRKNLTENMSFIKFTYQNTGWRWPLYLEVCTLFWYTALARLILARWPPDSLLPASPTWVRSPRARYRKSSDRAQDSTTWHKSQCSVKKPLTLVLGYISQFCSYYTVLSNVKCLLHSSNLSYCTRQLTFFNAPKNIVSISFLVNSPASPISAGSMLG